MSRSLRFVSIGLVSMAVVALFATVSSAQPGGGRGGFGRGMMQSPAAMWGMLLQAPTVQKDLNLTEDQQAKIKELSEKARAGMAELFQGMRDLSPEEQQARRAEMGKRAEEQRKSLEGILLPNQVARLKEIVLQRRGLSALQDKEIQETLALSDEQKEKLKTIQADARKKSQEVFQNQDLEQQARREKLQEIQKEASEAATAVLTSEQKEKFEKMQGTKLDIPQSELPSFGRRGGGQPKP